MKNMTLERITEVCGGVYYGSEADKKKEIVLYSNIFEQRSLKYLSS